MTTHNRLQSELAHLLQLERDVRKALAGYDAARVRERAEPNPRARIYADVTVGQLSRILGMLQSLDKLRENDA